MDPLLRQFREVFEDSLAFRIAIVLAALSLLMILFPQASSPPQ